MVRPPAERRVASEMLALIAAIPAGRVATTDALARRLNVIPTVIATLLNGLTTDERDTVPWYRVVAKGGAIGRGPHRDAQFAKLVREGVPMSPAGIVQDMARIAIAEFAAGAKMAARGTAPPPIGATAPASRSRGMKDRPG